MIPLTRKERDDYYRRALLRLTPAELEAERRVPYALSLKVLGGVFLSAAERLGLLGQKRPLILAVSGGSDSMALLWLFKTFSDCPLVVGHVEHGIRGEESRLDAAFVQEYAVRWQMPVETAVVDVPSLAEKGESLELAARRIRHIWLESLAHKYDAFGVALAHNKEDVAETVLFNLLRGSGVRGLVGIPERRGVFLRPLLACSRAFLREILTSRGLSWREDSTNSDTSYTRNFIRNNLLPSIENSINKKAVDHIVAAAVEMRYYREEEERNGRELLARVTGNVWPEDCAFSRKKLRCLSLRELSFLIREIGCRLGWVTLSRQRTLELARLIAGYNKFEFQWKNGNVVSGDRDHVSWQNYFSQ